MKRSVQILLIAAVLFPVLSSAREETMEERKQRITRKYLRERTTITQSEFLVPEEYDEDPVVLDSEKYLDADVDLERQEPGMRPLPQPRRQLRAVKQNRNWLLAEEPSMDDPYADPYSTEDPETDSDPGSSWTSRGEERNSRRTEESRYEQRTYDPYPQQQYGTGDSSRQGVFDPRDPRSLSSDGIQQEYQQQGSPFGGGYTYPGQSGETPSPYSGTGQGTSSFGTSPYSSFNQGTYQRSVPGTTGFPTPDRSFGSDPQEQRAGSVTPYRSPYQTPQYQQQWGGAGDQPQQEFQKQDTYQNWKNQNPNRYDPTSDDSYINEMMPKVRR